MFYNVSEIKVNNYSAMEDGLLQGYVYRKWQCFFKQENHKSGD